MSSISDSDVEQFGELGYFITDVIFSPEDLKSMADEMDRVYAEHLREVASSGDAEAIESAKGRRSFSQFHSLSAVAVEFVRKPIYLEACRKLIGENADLYYNQANTRNMVKYDLDSQSVVDTVELTNAGYRNTYHYQWGGYSDIDFAVDENGLWVLYATSSNSGQLVVSKLSEDLDIEDTWNTASEVKTSMGNAFVVCGVVYAIDSYSGSSTTINYAYDTSDSSDQSLSYSFENPGGYNSMVDYNYLEQQLWAWDNSEQITYEIEF